MRLKYQLGIFHKTMLIFSALIFYMQVTRQFRRTKTLCSRRCQRRHPKYSVPWPGRPSRWPPRISRRSSSALYYRASSNRWRQQLVPRRQQRESYARPLRQQQHPVARPQQHKAVTYWRWRACCKNRTLGSSYSWPQAQPVAMSLRWRPVAKPNSNSSKWPRPSSFRQRRALWQPELWCRRSLARQQLCPANHCCYMPKLLNWAAIQGSVHKHPQPQRWRAAPWRRRKTL